MIAVLAHSASVKPWPGVPYRALLASFLVLLWLYFPEYVTIVLKRRELCSSDIKFNHICFMVKNPVVDSITFCSRYQPFV